MEGHSGLNSSLNEIIIRSPNETFQRTYSFLRNTVKIIKYTVNTDHQYVLYFIYFHFYLCSALQAFDFWPPLCIFGVIAKPSEAGSGGWGVEGDKALKHL